jgi:diguanylate cyclase (GGDEF)-like protein
MPNKKLPTKGPTPELKKAFLGHLPHRVAAVEEAWHTLREGGWQIDLLRRLFQRVQALGGSCAMFDLVEVGEAVLSLEVFLSSFVAGGILPKPAQLWELDMLVQQLREVSMGRVGEGSVAAQEHPKTQQGAGAAWVSHQGQTVFVLENPDPMSGGLCPALNALDLKIRAFKKPADLRAKLKRQRPLAVISDVCFLSELSKSGVIEALQANRSGRVPLVFLGDPSNLEQRLEAMRAGSDAYMPLSVESDKLAAKIRELAIPPSEKLYRVLIVDDDPTQAEHAAAILRKGKMQTCMVMEPLKVLDAIREFQPDLVLLDLYMPDADGVELTTIIREHPEFVHIPIVFLSGELDPDKQLLALSAGGEDFLDKPIRPRHLIKTVSNRIRRAQELETSLVGSVSRDRLTGLMDRRALMQALHRVSAEQINAGTARGILFIGIDAAERLLDSMGIRGMDALIAKTGALISDALLRSDTAGRFGDYSFVVLAERAQPKAVSELAAFLCKSIEGQLFELANRALSITLSIGIYLVQDTEDDPWMLVSHAEKAYRMARDAGGNQAHVFVERAIRDSTRLETKQLEGLIRKALAGGGFRVMFQPIVPLRRGGGEHYQTLLRLPAGGGEFIPAGDFIPVAERSDLIFAVDRWVTEFSLKVIGEKRRQRKKIHLFVSQSVGSVNDPERIAWLKERCGLLVSGAAELTFEFQISGVASHLAPAKAFFESLQSMGIGILLTGVTDEASHLKLLKHLSVDFVKVAFEFVKRRPEKLVSVIEQIHELGKPAIAQQIEDPQVIAQLWMSGVDFIQGNFIQRPGENLGYDFSESVLVK